MANSDSLKRSGDSGERYGMPNEVSDDKYTTIRNTDRKKPNMPKIQLKMRTNSRMNVTDPLSD